jgi:hypothetical protein
MYFLQYLVYFLMKFLFTTYTFLFFLCIYTSDLFVILFLFLDHPVATVAQGVFSNYQRKKNIFRISSHN